MTTSRWHYVRELAEQLRINGVPEARVRDIVAEVEGHAVVTGEDLVSTFGQPVDYAARWRPLQPRRWTGQVLLGGATALGVGCAVKAVLADQPWADDVPISASDTVHLLVIFAVVALMPWTAGLVESRGRASRLGESRPPSVWPVRFAIAAVVCLGVGVLAWVVTTWWGATALLEVPRWSLVPLALAGLAVGSLAGPTPNSAGRLPDAPWAPPPSWRTRVRRAFANR
jgi:hypothetical protein